MFTKTLRSWVSMLKEGEVFLAKNAYLEYFSDMEESTFYQLLARIHNEGLVGKLAKGLYFRPYSDDFSRVPDVNMLLSFFTKQHKNGILVGEYMLAEYNIIDSPQGMYEVYTNVLDIKTKRVFGNICVREIQVDFKNKAIVLAIYMLEIINIIDSYNNINYVALRDFLIEFAANYDQTQFMKVIQSKNYKKRNIAVVYEILSKFRVQNTLNKLLNSASKYQDSAAIKKALEIGEELYA